MTELPNYPEPGDVDYDYTKGWAATIAEVEEGNEDDNEDNDEDNEINRDRIEYTSGTKEFNFDYFLAAKPGIVQSHPYDFSDAKFRDVAKFEPELKDIVMDQKIPRSDGWEDTKTTILKRPWWNYFCGCIAYRHSDCDSTAAIPRTYMGIAPEYQSFNHRGIEVFYDTPGIVILEGVHSNELKLGEPIYYVTSHVNLARGISKTQRWRRGCWETMEPILRKQWEVIRQIRSEAKAQKYFDQNSVLDESGQWVLKSPARGNRSNIVTLSLSTDEAQERTKLILRHANYRRRRQVYVDTNKPIDKIEVLLNQIHDQVINLGGVPSGWEYYN